jgi:hypothetical protein
MDTTLCRITARGLLGVLVGVGLLSCSSAHKATHDTETASLSSNAAQPSSPVPSATQSFTATQSGGSAVDSSAAQSRAPSPAAVPKHGSSGDRRSVHATRALKRDGVRCVRLAANARTRTDFSSSPVGINPCGLGSMNLPTMAVPNLAAPPR